jgi:hypothetical protein
MTVRVGVAQWRRRGGCAAMARYVYTIRGRCVQDRMHDRCEDTDDRAWGLVMRQFIAAAAAATGLVGLWAVLLPLAAQPAPDPANSAAPALSRALFLCRGPNGIDRTCAAALAQAVRLTATGERTGRVAHRVCHVDHNTLANLSAATD